MSLTTVKDISEKHEVEYNDSPTAKQRYKLDGKAVPGVTTFIKAGLPTSQGLVLWKLGKAAEFVYDAWLEETPPVRENIVKAAKTAWKKDAEEAAGIGTIVHDYAYLSRQGRCEEALEKLAEHEGSKHWESIQNAVYKVDNFNEQNKDKLLHLETIVGSPRHHFAGRFDCLVSRNDMVIISDYKTSAGFYYDQFIQDAAYSIAIEEWLGIKVEGFEVIRFGKEDGDFKTLLITDPLEIKELQQKALDCLDTYTFLKKWSKDIRFK